MTDTLLVLVKGMVLGLAVAAPVGPVGLLCIRRSLAQGFLPGAASGLGTAVADALYAAVAAFGLNAVSGLLLSYRPELELFGGLALLWVGLTVLMSKAPQASDAPPPSRPLWPTFVGTFLVTMANPTTIVTFAALFAGFGLGAVGTTGSAGTLVGGVLLGSLTWWAILAGTVTTLRRRFSPSVLLWINRGAGVALAAFGLGLLINRVMSG
jgi:putative LysE/RhtB family amino acid efflux pump